MESPLERLIAAERANDLLKLEDELLAHALEIPQNIIESVGDRTEYAVNQASLRYGMGYGELIHLIGDLTNNHA